MCSEFLFSTGSDLPGVKTFPDLQSYMAKTAAGHRALVGDLYGTWTIPAAYIQAFVQSHTAATAADAAAAPIDLNVIARIAKFGTYCASSGADPCIDSTFHNGADGAVEQAFDAGYAANSIGFSERSFFLELYQQAPASLALVAMLGGTSRERRNSPIPTRSPPAGQRAAKSRAQLTPPGSPRS
jgi:hypothetical protein